MSEIKTITVAALTAGVNSPSSRFRIRQHILRLAKFGVTVHEHIPAFKKGSCFLNPITAAARIPGVIRSYNADLVWLNRELVKGCPTFEHLLKRPRVMDVDDAIWLLPPFGRWAAPQIAKSMDAIVAGNSYLAEYFAKYCKNVYIVPTAIDLDRYQLRPNIHGLEPEKFVIGWTGLACNYKYLATIEPALTRFLQDHDRAELMLLSNQPWKQKTISAEKINFIPWTMENETTTLHSMSVGLMSLTDNKWTKGKCSFKMLQYMAVGLPVIVSPVGMNNDVLEKGQPGLAATSPNQWYDALKTLYDDWSLQQQMGTAGRQIVQDFYSADIIAQDLAQIFKTIVNG